MSTRYPRWVAAAAATAFTLQALVFTTVLPRPAAATDLATPPARSAAAAAPAMSRPHEDARLARGQYLSRIGGCHDCHTAGYAETAGDVPVDKWFTGSDVGYKGPWGVSYASNLRLTMQQMTEAQWLAFARVPRLPPMPWFNLRDMSDEDLRALYRYVRWLGPAGEQAPLPLAAGAQVSTPYYEFEPRNLPATAKH